MEGVLGGGPSEVGVTVPESGAAGDGICEDSLSEEKMPDKMAIPRVPVSPSVKPRNDGWVKKKWTTPARSDR